MALPPGVAEVRRLVTERTKQGDHTAWNDAWVNSVTPWDANQAQPALIWALKYPEIAQQLPKGGKALVAGCGRGYDTAIFASAGYAPSIGVDISPVAVQKAQEWFASNGDQALQQAVRYIEADFFKLDTNPEVGTDVSLAYDYTFFCALPPTFRASWAETYAKVVKKGGVLLCLAFPIQGDRPGGPPYSVSPEMYKELLSPNFDLVWEGEPLEQQEARKGIEQVLVWRRK